MSIKAIPFWDRVVKGDGCWSWTGNHDDKGYARVWRDGRTALAHRVAYIETVGPVPEGLELDHLCRNRGCVRPDHLEPVTHTENMRRSPLAMARREVCQRGHPIEYIRPSGRRGCRTCRYEAVKRWRARIAQEDAA